MFPNLKKKTSFLGRTVPPTEKIWMDQVPPENIDQVYKSIKQRLDTLSKDLTQLEESYFMVNILCLVIETFNFKLYSKTKIVF